MIPVQEKMIPDDVVTTHANESHLHAEQIHVDERSPVKGTTHDVAAIHVAEQTPENATTLENGRIHGNAKILAKEMNPKQKP